MTLPLGSFEREMRALAAAGTEALVRGPRTVDAATLMSPQSVPSALAMADEQADADAAAVGEFWRERREPEFARRNAAGYYVL